MPTGTVRWYDPERGFGFVSNPGGEDAYVAKSALPEGVTELKPHQRVEYEMVTGRRGPQAMRLQVLPELQRPQRAGRQGGAADTAAPKHRRRSADDLHGVIADLMTVLETKIQPSLRNGRYPDHKTGRGVAQILRAVARELD